MIREDMKVVCYQPNMEDIDCIGTVVGIFTDGEGDANFVVLTDDGRFDQCLVGYCKLVS